MCLYMMGASMSDNASLCQGADLVKALDALSETVLDIPVDLHRLWDPFSCPVTFLSWLADSLSVDTWDENWPESVKRRVIAESVPSHIKKGTVGAIRASLNALDVDVQLQEWWQTGGVPHTAKLTAIANVNLTSDGDTFLTPRNQAHIWQVVSAHKPLRTQVDFIIGVNLHNQVEVYGGASTTNLQQITWQDIPKFQFETAKQGLSSIALNVNMSNETFCDAARAEFKGNTFLTNLALSTNVEKPYFEDKSNSEFKESINLCNGAFFQTLSRHLFNDEPYGQCTSPISASSMASHIVVQSTSMTII